MDEIEKKLLEEIKENNQDIIYCEGKIEQHRQTMKWAKESELTFLELLLHLNPSEPVKHQIKIRKKQISGEQGK